MGNITMDELFEVLREVSEMSFEAGKDYMLTKYPNVMTYYNYDVGTYVAGVNLYDFNFMFNDDSDTMISFTTHYDVTDEENIVYFEKGYWHINGHTLHDYKALL